MARKRARGSQERRFTRQSLEPWRLFEVKAQLTQQDNPGNSRGLPAGEISGLILSFGLVLEKPSRSQRRLSRWKRAAAAAAYLSAFSRYRKLKMSVKARVDPVSSDRAISSIPRLRSPIRKVPKVRPSETHLTVARVKRGVLVFFFYSYRRSLSVSVKRTRHLFR